MKWLAYIYRRDGQRFHQDNVMPNKMPGEDRQRCYRVAFTVYIYLIQSFSRIQLVDEIEEQLSNNGRDVMVNNTQPDSPMLNEDLSSETK